MGIFGKIFQVRELFTRGAGSESIIQRAASGQATATGWLAAAFGYATAASGDNCFAAGSQTIASNSASAAFNSQCTASGNRSFAHGLSALANMSYQYAHGTPDWSGSGTPNGHCQYSRLVTRLSHSSSSPQTAQFFDGSLITVPAGKMWAFEAHIATCRTTNRLHGAYFVRRGIITRFSTNTQLVGTVQTLGADIVEGIIASVSITANDTNETLNIAVTAEANCRTVIVINLVEIGALTA